MVVQPFRGILWFGVYISHNLELILVCCKAQESLQKMSVCAQTEVEINLNKMPVSEPGIKYESS